ALVSLERVLARTASTPEGFISVDPHHLGLGPVTIQAVALYEDKEAVRSPPLSFRLAHLDQPPAVTISVADPDSNGVTRLKAVATDPEADTTRIEWLSPLPYGTDIPHAEWTLNGGTAEEAEGVITAKAVQDIAVAHIAWPGATNTTELCADISVPASSGPMLQQVAVLVFDYEGPETFSFFGLFGDASSWVMGRREAGEWKRAVTRGAYIEPGTWHRVSLRERDQGGVAAYLNDEYLCSWPEGRLAGPGVGIAAGATGGQFRSLRVAPACYPVGAFESAEDTLLIVDPNAAAGRSVIARGRDQVKSLESTWTIPDEK
ncbi:MAG TPA: hypothetical protein VIH35_05340, partial [Kiritimatiellia bacterium]